MSVDTKDLSWKSITIVYVSLLDLLQDCLIICDENLVLLENGGFRTAEIRAP